MRNEYKKDQWTGITYLVTLITSFINIDGEYQYIKGDSISKYQAGKLNYTPEFKGSWRINKEMISRTSRISNKEAIFRAVKSLNNLYRIPDNIEKRKR